MLFVLSETRSYIMNRSRIRKYVLVFTLLLIATALSSTVLLAGNGDKSWLTAIAGSGRGMFIVAPTASDQGTFAAEMNVAVHDTLPNTTFTAYRTPDRNNDGIPCNGTNTLPTFSFTTSAGGSGTGHFHYHAPFPYGETFHVRFEFRSSDGSTILQSECLTLTVK
jgi:hypothetical protein